MKKSATTLLFVAVLSFGYLPTRTMNASASNPIAVRGQTSPRPQGPQTSSQKAGVTPQGPS